MDGSLKNFLFHFLILVYKIQNGLPLSCFDESKNPVDWFMIYKFTNGYDYIYLDENNVSWKFSKYGINSSQDGAVYNTIQGALNSSLSANVMSVFYNDEHPLIETDSNIYGHMKGVLGATRGESGFWLIHSVPKFPTGENYTFPSSGKIFAQTFFCVTYNYSAIQSIAKQLAYGRPQVYKSHLPKDIADDYPDLLPIITNTKVRLVNSYSINSFVSTKGRLKITSFMKSLNFGKDLYDSLVAPTLNHSILFEGWMNGGGVLPSNCTAKYKVVNIRGIKFSPLFINFTTNHDHSKWAIDENGEAFWVCIGDINREVGQFHRGGGTACFQDADIWKQYDSLIADVDVCPLDL